MRSYIHRLTGPLAQTHPTRSLRWLRMGILLLVVASGLLCWQATDRTHQEIYTATGPGARAIAEIHQAGAELDTADTDAGQVLSSLTGPSSGYQDNFSLASQDLVGAAEDNIDGSHGLSDIQFAEGLLTTYNGLVQQAVVFAAADTSRHSETLVSAGRADATYFLRHSVTPALDTIRVDERSAVRADLGPGWLSPGGFWWLLLLASYLVMLLLAAATTYVFWHWFRRVLSRQLAVAIVVMLVLATGVAGLNVLDRSSTRGGSAYSGLAVSWWAVLSFVILGIAALVLAFRAYTPRLSEYRYQP